MQHVPLQVDVRRRVGQVQGKTNNSTFILPVSMTMFSKNFLLSSASCLAVAAARAETPSTQSTTVRQSAKGSGGGGGEKQSRRIQKEFNTIAFPIDLTEGRIKCIPVVA